MTADRWQQIKSLFDRALELDAASRRDFVRSQCGPDADLLREVETLLAADANAGTRLNHPVIRSKELETKQAMPGNSATPTMRICAYKCRFRA